MKSTKNIADGLNKVDIATNVLEQIFQIFVSCTNLSIIELDGFIRQSQNRKNAQ